jgi:DNA-binding LacI/PurR family transcriptional regulator
MRITVIDVAKAAGVSRTTVSNVLNGRAKCSEETKKVVLAAAKELGYKPNLAAKAMVTNRSNLIGLLLPSYIVKHTLTNSPFYTIIIDGIHSVLRDEEFYDLIIFCLSHRERLSQVSEWLDIRNVDGVIGIGEFDPDFLHELDERPIPTVLIDNYQAGCVNVSHINSDDELGGYLAAKKLIDAGYRKIGICSPAKMKESPLIRKRCEGYQKAINEAGYPEYIMVEKKQNTFDAGLFLGERVYAQGLDAVFCTEDILAVGVLNVMLRKGVKVGKEFGIIGFDNLNIGEQVCPGLSTIDQNIFEKGETAAKTLVRILRKETLLCTRLILPVRLVERESA